MHAYAVYRSIGYIYRYRYRNRHSGSTSHTAGLQKMKHTSREEQSQWSAISHRALMRDHGGGLTLVHRQKLECCSLTSQMVFADLRGGHILVRRSGSDSIQTHGFVYRSLSCAWQAAGQKAHMYDAESYGCNLCDTLSRKVWPAAMRVPTGAYMVYTVHTDRPTG